MKSPDETRDVGKGKVEITKVGETSIGRVYLEPGWSWEEHVKPIVKTKSCQAPHRQYIISGRVRVKMHDGAEEEFGPGDVGYVPPDKTKLLTNFATIKTIVILPLHLVHRLLTIPPILVIPYPLWIWPS
jgi:quercetin dioxygenase-like cupin family protein